MNLDDDESPDASGGLDLTPAAPRARRARTKGPVRWIVLAAVAVIVVVVLNKGLSSSATYFYNVDEAVAKRDEIGSRRIRVQGHVEEGSVRHEAEYRFNLMYNGVMVPVRLTKDPPDLFKPALPVVLEGAFDGDVFVSDNALIMHDEVYTEENGDRLKQAEDDALQAT